MTAHEPLVLAIDVGTSAVRAAALDPRGGVVATRRIERSDSSSGAVFDAALLWRQLGEATRGLPEPVRRELVGAAIAGHVGTVLADSAFEPVGPGRGWADASGIDLLAARAGSELPELLREIGRPALTGGAAAAALGLREVDADAFARVRHVLAPKDLLVARLTGIAATDATTAAYSSLSDVRERSWSARALGVAGLDESVMPPQLASTAIVGGVTARAAAETGLPVGLPVAAGGPDGTVGATFAIGEGRDLIADVAGTTDVIVRLVETADHAPGAAMVNPYTLGGWSAGGATGMTGGAMSRWAALLGHTTVAHAVAELERGVEAIPPGADGLFAYPALSGSRFPRWNPAETGLLLGQRDAHEPVHVLLAVAEGMAFVVREGIDLLYPDREASVVLAGGVARSRRLSQLRADVLDREVIVSREPDVSLMGAGLLAMLATGIHASAADAAAAREEEAERLSPDPERAAAYRELFAGWQEATRER